jgi:hypothetical protein
MTVYIGHARVGTRDPLPPRSAPPVSEPPSVRAAVAAGLAKVVQQAVPEGALLGIHMHPGLTTDGRRAGVVLVYASELPRTTIATVDQRALEVEWVPADALGPIEVPESAGEDAGEQVR